MANSTHEQTVPGEVLKMVDLITTQEMHYDTALGNLRTLASGWLLAAIGAAGSIYMRAEPASHLRLIPPLLLVLGGLGLVLLAVLDQVYQQFLRAGILVGLRLEHQHPGLPRTRTVRSIAAGFGTSRTLELFYLVPAAVLISVGFTLLSIQFFLGEAARNGEVFGVGILWIAVVLLLLLGLRELFYERNVLGIPELADLQPDQDPDFVQWVRGIDRRQVSSEKNL